ncbi:hypothetical protein ABVT39_001970 [Epinephelus coioides]
MEELLFLQPGKKKLEHWAEQQSSSPSRSTPVTTEQSQHQSQLSCFNLLDRSCEDRLPDRPDSVIQPEFVSQWTQRKRRSSDSSPPSPHTDFFLSFSVMHPQSHCPILSLIALFITTNTHTHAHRWQKITLDVQSPMGGSRNMFV